jgi:hypothetical protein
MRYSEYTERLRRCGISAHEAVSMVCDFEKHSDINSLENYVASVEREVFPSVDKVQCEPDSK